MKAQRAVVVGFEYYGRYLAELISEHSDTWEMVFRGSSYLEKLRAVLDLRSASALVCFGGPGPDAVLAEAARRNGVPVIVIWAGTDVVKAAEDPELLAVLKQDEFINVSDGPWLVDELRKIGVETSYVPVTAVRAVEQAAPFPRDFRVLSYLPEPRRAFYGEAAVYAIARAMPEVHFRIVGKGDRNPAAPSNVEFLGYVDGMPQLLDDSVALLRLPEHDGKSMLVLEALARGRHVVWAYDFPGCTRAESVPEATAYLQELQRAHAARVLPANGNGLDFVRETFSRERVASGFEKVLNDAAQRRRRDRRQRAHRVVLTGYNLFSAHIANAIRAKSVEWEPRVLRANRRLERIVSAAHVASADVWYTIGAPIPDRLLHLVATLLRKPRVVHWVGSDVMQLQEKSALAKWCRSRGVINLAEVDWMIDELAQKGIDAQLAPLPPQVVVPKSIPPLPPTFTVLLYIPRVRGEFYGRKEYERLFRAFAGQPVRFLVAGGGAFTAPCGSDVTGLGWTTDLPSIYEQSSVLLRYTRHDGLSLMALEALSFGRHLVWTKAFPHSRKVSTYEDCESAVATLLEQHLAGQLKPQEEAAAYVRSTYDRAKCIDRIAGFWSASLR